MDDLEAYDFDELRDTEAQKMPTNLRDCQFTNCIPSNYVARDLAQARVFNCPQKGKSWQVKLDIGSNGNY